MKRILFPLFLLVHVTSGYGQVNKASSQQIISGLKRLNDTPASIVFNNKLEINNRGGHLQGIQYLLHDKNAYYVLSGSSDEYAYYSIVKTGKENTVISVNKIIEKPYKHAGGFQIFENLMAIGVEDNEAKDRSKVYIFKLDNPKNPPEEPLSIIERKGESKRASAGCVGITIYKNRVLLVVGDWDTEHLDFYISDYGKQGLGNHVPELVYSLDTKEISRARWIDGKWLAYQNINLLQDDSGQLFLAGMASDASDENILDLYKIDTDDLSSFNLQKIFTRKFEQNDKARFRWGAGIFTMDNKQFRLVVCGEHIEKNSMIHVY